MFGNVYKNRKVLITGHTGFKGSWLTLWLLELGAKVVGYSLDPPTNPNLFSTLNLKDKIVDIRGDIRNLDHLQKVLDEYNPEIIFHLAAQPLVKLSYEEPKETFETNILGTVNVFEAVRKSNSVKVVVNVTTDKCYKNNEWCYGYRENDPMGGHDPYSSSKGCSELITKSYEKSFFSNDVGTLIASARAGNVIGGGDWAKYRLITDCIESIQKQEQILIRNPKAIRPWQLVLEPLSGYLLLGTQLFNEKKDFSGGWNFGPNNEDVLEVELVVKKLISIYGEGSFKVEKSTKHHEANLLKLDTSKALHYLGWKPVYGSGDAINTTVKWYKNYYNNINMYNFSILQINEYIKKAKDMNLNWTR